MDTGSTRSLIRPSLAKKHFGKSIRNDPFEVRTAHGRSVEKYSVEIPTFKIFKSNTKIKLHLFEFHQFFDCLLGMDALRILGLSLQEHLQNIRSVIDRPREFNLKIQLDKSEFLKKEVAYLGHVVTQDGVKPNPDKIKAIKSYPIPRTTKQLKGFLGLLGYYRKFVRDFAKLTKPLTKCLKKDAKINIDDPEYKDCFEKCKVILSDEPVLQYPDFTKPFVLTTDASCVALGAVLSQGTIGQGKPIAYASRTLNDHEKRNYSTIERELLGIVWAVKHFRPFLFGRRFQIVTDHKPLIWLFSLKDPSSKMTRWRLKLEEYDYEVIYKKGSLNSNANALSRIELVAYHYSF